MNHLTEVAIQRNCERIRLTVDAANVKAVALYNAHHYEVDVNCSCDNRLVMYRNLNTTVNLDN